MTRSFPEPTEPAKGRPEVMVRYLDFFRRTAIEKVTQLPDTARRASVLPSGWAPVELLQHLRHVERRWLVWGFLGVEVDDPWADERDGRWFVAEDRAVDEVVAALLEQGRISTTVITDNPLDRVGAPGPRWEGAEPPTLERICLHLVQEYARHVGQLDVVVELQGGVLGE